MHLGPTRDRYRAQQSIRTFFNTDRPERHYVKTALAIQNMGFLRGLSPKYMEATPAINDWVADVVAGDPELAGCGFRVLRERATEQQAVLGELGQLGADVPVTAVRYTAAEPTGVGALRELGRSIYGESDPAGAPEDAPVRPLMEMRRTAGHGVSPDTEFELDIALPGAQDAPLDLARIGDDMVVGIGFSRRVVSLPAVLRRCEATGARLEGTGADARLVISFVPDPGTWMTS